VNLAPLGNPANLFDLNWAPVPRLWFLPPTAEHLTQRGIWCWCKAFSPDRCKRRLICIASALDRLELRMAAISRTKLPLRVFQDQGQNPAELLVNGFSLRTPADGKGRPSATSLSRLSQQSTRWVPRCTIDDFRHKHVRPDRVAGIDLTMVNILYRCPWSRRFRDFFFFLFGNVNFSGIMRSSVCR
jgi:hypothetical protein